MPQQQLFLGVGASLKTYIDDVFATQLYLGNDTSNTDITNGIDLAGEGGFVWIKNRDDNSSGYAAFDTVRGVGDMLRTNTTGAESYEGNTLTTFNSNGFRINSDNLVNKDNDDFTSWTFRKAPGFFDVVTYTGNGADDRAISHSLGSIPGMIIVKALNDSSPWTVYHRQIGATKYLYLNDSQAEATDEWWADTTPTASNFYVQGTRTNANNTTFVAYVFAGGESTAATSRSVDFSGSGQMLSLANSADFNVGTNHTAECWFYCDDITSTGNNDGTGDFIIGNWEGNSDWKFEYTGTNLRFYYGTGSNDWMSVGYPPEKQWHHIAFSKEGTNTRVFLNGTQIGSAVDIGARENDNPFTVAGVRNNVGNVNRPFNGKISNVRIVQGTAVYTSSFRPPTEPLTNITNTTLLMCNNSSTTGSTVTPGAITATGSPTASTDSPFDDPAGFVFGDSKEGIVKCGSYKGNGDANNGTNVYLGFEPQWVLIKPTGFSEHWHQFDSMRGMVTGGNDSRLEINQAGAETNTVDFLNINPDGFTALYDPNINKNNEDFVYIAIRRPDGYVGKPADAGTDVFGLTNGAGNSSRPAFVTNFPVDFNIFRKPAENGNDWQTGARLIGPRVVYTNNTNAEQGHNDYVWDSNVGVFKDANSDYQAWSWKRHAGFDVVTYEGNGALRSISHSMGIAPEMMWFKRRNGTKNWYVYHKGLDGGSSPEDYSLRLNTTAAEDQDGNTLWNQTVSTATHFTLNTDSGVNDNGDDYIAMLFASVNGISKIGSYAGNCSDGGSTTQAISTGFSPRFLFIKNISASDNWFVWDTTRGFTGSASTNPFLFLNSNSNQNNTYSWADAYPTSTGFVLPAGGAYGTNRSGFNYIYYAHA